MRLTIDAAGRVAEARIAAFSVRTNDATVSFSGADPRTLNRTGAGQAAAVMPVVEALGRAATDAVRQWRYDPPAEAPLSFFVSIDFGDPPPPPPPPPSRTPRAGTRPPPPAPAVQKTPGIPPPPPPPPQATRIDEMAFVPAEPSRTPDGALRVGGAIPPPRKVRDVRPVYPADAMAAGVQGVVILELRIESDGTVGDVRVLRSIPLLDQAAIDAARQWVFTPTLLNGVPTPAIITTTVNFLQQMAGVYRPGNGVRAPRLVYDAKPVYTEAAMAEKIQGVVSLNAVVLPDGAVGDVSVTKSLDAMYGLDEEAVRAMKQWRFEPGTKDGEPVPVQVEVEMTFTLK
jgi:protein TonB